MVKIQLLKKCQKLSYLLATTCICWETPGEDDHRPKLLEVLEKVVEPLKFTVRQFVTWCALLNHFDAETTIQSLLH